MENEPCLHEGKRSKSRKEPGPDGTEAWCVALAACFINFVMAGLGRMGGILYVAFIDVYQIDRKQASFPSSVRSSTRNLLGPLVGILGQKYGVRPITVIGAILGAASAAACFFVEDILWTTVVWGGLNGIGTALTTTLPLVTIGQHFKKHRSTAAGMAFSGGCFGAFLFPALLEYLLNTYGMQGTFLLIGGILMQVIPAAMILRKPTWLNKKQPRIVVSASNGHIGKVAEAVGEEIENNETKSFLNDADAQSNISHKKQPTNCNTDEVVNGDEEKTDNEKLLRLNDAYVRNFPQENELTNFDIGQVADGVEEKVPSKETEIFLNEAAESNISRRNMLEIPSFLPKSNTSRALSENFSKIPVDDKRPDFILLWENRKLVFRLLTDDFMLQSAAPEEVNQNKSFTNDTLIQEIEDLFYKIVTDVRDESPEKEFAPDNTSVKADAKFEDKCTHLKNKAFINGNSKSKMIDFDVITSNPLNSLFFYLEDLFERDKNIIVHSFSENEHEISSKILEELRKVHHILKDNKTNMYLCTRSTTSLFFDSNSINFEDNVSHPNTFSSHIKTALQLHKKPMFILISLCRCVHFLIFMPILTTIVDFSKDKGLQTEDGKYVIAALSLGDLLGRLCFGWITDKGFVSLPRYMLFVMIMHGVSTATLSFMNSKASLMTAIAVFGLLQGSIFVRHPVLVSKYLGSHEQSIAMGCINFFSGILAFTLPNYIGYFRDTMGSYNGMLYINGAIGAFVGLLWMFEPYFSKLSVLRERRNHQTQV